MVGRKPTLYSEDLKPGRIGNFPLSLSKVLLCFFNRKAEVEQNSHTLQKWQMLDIFPARDQSLLRSAMLRNRDCFEVGLSHQCRLISAVADLKGPNRDVPLARAPRLVSHPMPERLDSLYFPGRSSEETNSYHHPQPKVPFVPLA